MERRLTVFFLLLAWAGVVRAAEPPSPEERAAAHLEAGNTRLEAGDFAGAAAEYRAGHALYPRASLLFNLGLAELRQEHLLEAAEALEGALARPDATPEVTEQAREQLDRIDQKLALYQLNGLRGTALSVDGRARGALPLDGPLRLVPGTHRLGATLDGYRPLEREVAAVPGAHVTLQLALDPLPPPPKPRPRYWLWGTIGAAVAAGAVVTYLILRDPCRAEQCLTFKNMPQLEN